MIQKKEKICLFSLTLGRTENETTNYRNEGVLSLVHDKYWEKKGIRMNKSSNVLQLKYEMVLSDVLFNNKTMIERGGGHSQ